MEGNTDTPLLQSEGALPYDGFDRPLHTIAAVAAGLFAGHGLVYAWSVEQILLLVPALGLAVLAAAGFLVRDRSARWWGTLLVGRFAAGTGLIAYGGASLALWLPFEALVVALLVGGWRGAVWTSAVLLLVVGADSAGRLTDPAAWGAGVALGGGVGIVVHVLLKRVILAGASRQRRYEDLFAALNDPVLLLEPQTMVVTGANPAVARLCGRPIDELYGRPFADALAPDVLPGTEAHSVRDWLLEVRQSGEGGLTFLVGTPEGTKRVTARAQRIRCCDDDVIQVLLADETDRHQREERLRESERRYRALAEATSEGIVIHEQGSIIDGNSTLYRMFAVDDPGSLIGRSVFEFIAPESRMLIGQHMASGERGPYKAMALRADGSRFEVQARVGFMDWDGRSVRIVALRDMSTVRHVQRQLELVTSSLNGAGDGVVIADAQGQVQYMNRMARRFIQHIPAARTATLEEMVGTARAAALRAVLRHGGVWTDELVVAWGEQERTLRLRAVPVEGGESNSYVVVFLADVTALRDTEAALADREHQLAELLETLPELVWSLDLTTGIFHYISSAVESICGISRAKFREDPAVWRTLVHPDDRATVERAMDALDADGSFELEYRLVRPDGTVCWIYDSRRLYYDAQGEPVRSSGLAIDITERKQQEVAFKLQAEQMQTIMDHAPVLIARFDRDLRHLFVNSHVAKIGGLPAERFIGKTNEELGFDPDVVAFWNRELRKVFTTGAPHRIEFEHKREHETFNLEALAVPDVVVDGEVQTIISFTRDVSQRVAAERRLARQERFYRTVLERSFDAFAVLSKAGRPIYINRTLREFLQVDGASEEIDLLRGVAPGDRPFARRVLVRLLREPGVVQAGEMRWYSAEDQARVMSFKAVNYLDDPAIRGLVVVMRDVTEERRLERAVLGASDTERQRIGLDIHDGLGQHLTGIALMAKLLNRRLLADGDDAHAEAAAEIEMHVNQVIRETRFLVHGLCPVELERYGLVGALQSLVAGLTARALTCRFESELSVVELDDEVATHLYRIAQEAVTNAVRHSGAQTLTVRLYEDARALVLAVLDDGCGLDRDRVRTSVGLKSMAYRAQLIGARFTINSRPESGTTVVCRLPQQPAFTLDTAASGDGAL